MMYFPTKIGGAFRGRDCGNGVMVAHRKGWGANYGADLGERSERHLVEKFVAQAGVEAPDEGVPGRLAGRDGVPLDAHVLAQRSTARLVNSVPLSETHMLGRPRRATTASSSRTTRNPGSDVSATSVRHSRVTSSTTARIRKRRPSAKASDRKSRLQRRFGPC